MNDSNFFILKYYRLKPSEREQRVKFLQDTLTQLESYHLKAKESKRPVIVRLIARYDELLASLI